MKKHNAIVQGAIYRRKYKVAPTVEDFYYGSGYIKSGLEGELYRYEVRLRDAERYKIIELQEISSYENIWTGEIDAPLLEVGEKLYIEALDIEVTVTERIRHSNGAYIYRTKHEVKTIEDNESKETKDKSNKKYNEKQEIIKTCKAKIEELKPQIEQLRQSEHDNYYDENGLLRAFPKDYIELKRSKSWLERWFG